MDLLLKPLTEPVNYIYLSGIFLIIFGALIGITPPDSRKTLHTGLAIPIFISLGLINIFRSFDFLAGINTFVDTNAFLQIVVIIFATELGRQNLENAFDKKKFSPLVYIPLIIFLVLLSYKYDFTRRIIRRIIILIAKLFAIIVTIKATKILPNYNRISIISSFIVAIIGSFIQFILDLNFASIVNGHYRILPHETIYLYYVETISTLTISIFILKRRYLYEKSRRLHIPNVLSLISPMVVFTTSIVIALGVLIGSNMGQNTYIQVGLLSISLIIIFILYIVLYGIAYNSEKLQAIEAAQTNFEHILYHTPEPICVINKDNSIILAVNKSMQKSFGYSESLIGKRLDDMTAVAKQLKYNINSTNDVDVSECSFKKANGEIFTAEVTASFIEHKGEEAILLNIHDISIFKEIEEKLTEAKNRAEEANQVKSKLLSNASHELRTPMTAIIGLSELAASLCENEKQKQVVELLQTSSKSLMSLVNDMFELTEVQKGKIKINNIHFNLKHLLDEMSSYISFLSKRNNKNIVLEFSQNIPILINSDIDHIRHILMAIIDYSSDICLDKILVNICISKTSNNTDSLNINISEINREKLDEIRMSIDNYIDYANPYQASLTRKFASKLTLITLIINSMNGYIKINENETQNLSLEINIPIEIINEENSKEEFTPEDYPFFYNGKPLNFLIADDNDVNLFFIESIINRFNGRYSSVKNGMEVLENLRKQEFDVILLDLQMPKMDGMSTLKEIRSMSNKTSEIPVVAISAFASEEEKKKILKAGAHKYLVKPFLPKDLHEIVASIFKLDKNVSLKQEKNREQDNKKDFTNLTKQSNQNNEDSFIEKLKQIDYYDFKMRLAPNKKSIDKLDEIYNRRYISLDIEVDNCINENDSEKLREVAHSIKGLVGMMSAKKAWEIARNIETKASEGNINEAISKIGELRIMLSDISDDLQIIKKFIQ